MRKAAFVSVMLAASFNFLPALASPSVEELFRAFDLFGNWASDCKQPATAANPHVEIAAPSAGEVVEEHDLGSGFARNRYIVLSAARISATQLSVSVNFQPSGQAEERQKLVFLIRNGTRRTIFNQPEGGTTRVKNGIAVELGVKTPVLKKCG
jgi:hypothetical protein